MTSRILLRRRLRTGAFLIGSLVALLPHLALVFQMQRQDGKLAEDLLLSDLHGE